MTDAIVLPPRAPARPLPPRTPIRQLDVDAIRVRFERELAERLERVAGPLSLGPRDDVAIRRTVLASTVRLSPAMAPRAASIAEDARRTLGVDGEIELFQRNGPENASMHGCERPILLELHGRMLPLLDDGALLSVMGHELGHYLAHGPRAPHRNAHVLTALLHAPDGVSDELLFLLRALSHFREFTADRFGLLACQDVGAALRVFMVLEASDAGDVLTYDVDAYLAQCRELVESSLRRPDLIQGVTHPESPLRGYAIQLFSETTLYRQLTGKGPGTRDVREIDELILRFVGFGDRVPSIEPPSFDERPAELVECALAAAVLVAWADGELADEEADLIQRELGASVPRWQELLDQTAARDRFHETAPVVAAFGRELLHPLFQLLTRVMFADGVVDARELGAIRSIGAYFGCEDEWLSLLAVTLRTHGVSLPDVAPLPLPLPPRASEVREVVDLFFRGIARRGDANVTLRRLLKLAGADHATPPALALLNDAMRRHGVRCEADLQKVTLDEPLALRSQGLASTPSRPSLRPDGSRAGLMRALARLRDQLVSGDGRSPSVRVRRLRSGQTFDLHSLENTSVGLAERVLMQVRELQTAKLLEATDAGRHAAAKTSAEQLLALDREYRSRAEETGAHDLYVGYPFVTGIVAQQGTARSSNYLVRGPLVLYPVDIERDGAGARGFKLKPRKDETPIVNQSLLRLVFHKRGFAFGDELGDELDELAAEPGTGPEKVIQRLKDVGLALARQSTELRAFRERPELEERPPGLELEELAVLGLFPQSSSDLLQDYDGLITDLEDPRRPVATLLGAAHALLPDVLADGVGDAARASEDADHPVILADPSQREVLSTCRKNPATVVDGPPGTGKSQVIVNLVADALRRGERVAVVCEKRAAIDVVAQRLASVGLRQDFALVHDVHEDRKGLYAQIAERLDSEDMRPFDAKEAERLEREHRSVRDALARRGQLLAWKPEGVDLTIGQLHALASGLEVPALRSDALARVSKAQLGDLLDVVGALHPLRDLWMGGSTWSVPRQSLATYDRTRLQALEAHVQHALRCAMNLENLAERLPVAPATLLASRDALQAARASRAARQEPVDLELFGSLLSLGQPDRVAPAADAVRAWRSGRDAMLRFEEPVALTFDNEVVASLAVVKRWSGSFARFFVWAWWKARGQVRAWLRRALPERAADAVDAGLVADLEARFAASRVWQSIVHAASSLGLERRLPRESRAIGSFVERLGSVGKEAHALLAGAPALAAVGAWSTEWSASSVAQWDARVDERLAYLDAYDALVAAAAPVAQVFTSLGATPTAASLAALLGALRKDGERVVESDALLERAQRLLPGALELLGALPHALPDAPVHGWREAVVRAWAETWLAALEARTPELAQLGTPAEERETQRQGKRLAELESELSDIQAERIVASVDVRRAEALPVAARYERKSEEQKAREEMLKESRKKRRLMPLRTFVRKFAPRGLLDAVPVWLLSPETMAVLFPREALFDLVVIDEASQCTVESGLPALFRGKRVVIAGDEKQMPPTSYFALGGGTDDDDEGGVEVEAEAEAIRDLLSSESLLTLARSRVAHAGLKWHYRCRDEALIAFSNHAMYGGDLQTIPATSGPAAPSALKWIHVPDGSYDAGVNLPEAERVVDQLHELLARPDAPTLGVITFNLKQRKAILDAIERRRAKDTAFGRLWDDATGVENLDDRPFVKNLENVQGDERDVILFSLGHAPQERRRKGQVSGEKYVPARFGPLGQKGGERRLNVAISRAKHECYVVSSFDPDLLSIGSAKNPGPYLFKQFLEFSRHRSAGRHAQADRVLSLVRESAGKLGDLRPHTRLPVEGFVPLRAQIALALEAAGIPHELDVGASGFRVPIAILDPKDPNRFVVGLLLDEGLEPITPFERHVHRANVLGDRGWKVLPVTAAAWRRRPAEILQAIEALVPGVRGAVHTPVYRQHLAALRAPAKVEPPPKSEPPRARPVRKSQPVLAAVTTDAPTPNVPAWAAAIDDPLYRKALLHLETHGSISETELINVLGSPRRARSFAVTIEKWKLPFAIEVSTIGGVKVYRAKK
jgi:hypothetical protein